MYPGIWTNQCSLGMGLDNVLYEWDYPIFPLRMGLANVPWEWD